MMTRDAIRNKDAEAEPKEPPPEACGNCRYYAEYEDDEPGGDDDADADDDADEDEDAPATGYCRRYPPRVFPGLTPISVCPDVEKSAWCGEYMPKL